MDDSSMSKSLSDDSLERFKIFYNDGLFGESIPLMNELRCQGKLCDIKLRSGGQSFPAHKIILAAAIPYFHSVFTRNRLDEIAMETIEPCALENLINYAYSATIRIDYTNAQSLLVGAMFLQLNNVSDACAEFLISGFNAQNVLGIRQWAASSNCKSLVKAADEYINYYFIEVCNSKEFLTIDHAYLIELIRRDELNVQNEEVIFVACMRWAKYNEQGRSPQFAEVFSRVRLPLLPPLYLIDHVCQEDLVNNSLECMHLVDEAKNYHLLPERRHLLQTDRTCPRFVYGKIFVLGQNQDEDELVTTVDVYNPMTGKQIKGKQMLNSGVVDGVAVFGANLYVFGYNSTTETTFLQIYDSDANKWSEGNRTRLKLREVGVTTLQDFIYLCGGYKDTQYMNTVQRFNPKTHEWTQVSPTRTRRSGACAASLNGTLYVLGGFDGISIMESVERYDLVRYTWSKVKSMIYKRRYFCTATLNGKLYACGGHDGNSFLESAEVYDPNINTWQLITPMHCKRCNFGLVVFMKKLWAIGGRDGETDHSTIEVYDPDTDEWTFATPMKSDRHFVGAGVIPTQ